MSYMYTATVSHDRRFIPVRSCTYTVHTWHVVHTVQWRLDREGRGESGERRERERVGMRISTLQSAFPTNVACKTNSRAI